MPYGLTYPQLKNIRDALQGCEAVQEVILFGARIQGDEHDGEELNLALKGEEISVLTVMDLSESLDQFWFDFKVDLNIYSNIIDPILKDRIDRMGVVFYER